jgi:hypothetical protein
MKRYFPLSLLFLLFLFPHLARALDMPFRQVAPGIYAFIAASATNLVSISMPRPAASGAMPATASYRSGQSPDATPIRRFFSGADAVS